MVPREPRGDEKMKILLYFDWVGTRIELREHDKKMRKSCIETVVEHEGLYGSMNEKWNYVWVFEANSFDHFLEMSQKVPRPVHMVHYITELLIPIKL
jgi:hypothetical protein